MWKVLPAAAPGLTQSEIRAAVVPHLPQDLCPGGAKAGWWAKAVQLDLEAKGTLVRGRPNRCAGIELPIGAHVQARWQYPAGFNAAVQDGTGRLHCVAPRPHRATEVPQGCFATPAASARSACVDWNSADEGQFRSRRRRFNCRLTSPAAT